MAEPDQPKEEGSIEGAADANPNEISLDDIDDILAEEDPEFADEMLEMAADDDLKNAEVESLSIDGEGLLAEDEAEEGALSLSEKYPRLAKFLKPAEKIKNWSVERFLRIKNSVMVNFQSLRMYLRVTLPEQLRYLKSIVGGVVDRQKQRWAQFQALPLKRRLLYTFGGFIMIALVVVIKVNVSNLWIPNISERFLVSLAPEAQSVEKFDAENGLEFFYQAFPQPDFTVILDKVIVSLKREVDSKSPFGAFQFYVTTDSQEAAIEVKDREREMLDRISRAVEDFTFRQANSKEGKIQIKRAVRDAMNEPLNQGQVTKVYYKIMITHP